MDPPAWPWCTLNTDGAHEANGVSTAGGVIRDFSGRWLSGFGMMIGSCSVMLAELRGLYQGTLLAYSPRNLYLFRYLFLATNKTMILLLL